MHFLKLNLNFFALFCFVAIGTNSIIVYVGHILLGGYFPFDIYQQEKTHLTYLTANLVAVCVWMLIAFYWYSIGFFVKI